MSVVAMAKAAAYRVQPDLYAALRQRYRAIRQQRRRIELQQIDRELIRRLGRRVRTGPFTGMRYINVSSWDHVAPKLMGSYESELHTVIARAAQQPYTTVVDIGCAEGYYAVGLAMLLHGARVYAYDIDPYAQQLCSRMARENGVADRVVVRGECTPDALNPLIGNHSLIVSDCEGYELHLLDPARCPNLALADMIVELHDFVDPQISRSIIRRFSASHDIELISSVAREPHAYPWLSFLSERRLRAALDEFRPGVMQWAVLTSRHGQRRAP